MIKVNLLVNKARDPNLDLNAAGVKLGNTEPDAAVGDPREALMKLLFIVGWFFLIYGYEWYNISSLNATQAEVIAQRDAVAQEKANLVSENQKYLRHQQSVKELDEKLQILTSISKRRLLILKALDHLQSLMPARVWLTNIRYDALSATGVNEAIEFNGSASSQDELNLFVERIETNPDFQDMVLVSSTEQKSTGASYLNFVIRGRLNDKVF